MAKDIEHKEEAKSPHALREEEVLAFWQENGIFKKTEGRGDNEFIFYDGPPFANGAPHYGHILASTIKDAIPRYQVMQGKKLRRRWGWDCHGLPVENLVEKELGLKSKKDIEEYGIEKFNAAARTSIMKDVDLWKEQVPRLGRFVDMEDDYKTMDPSFTESVWWAFKTLYEKNLIYKGFKAMHLCPRCGTTLSNFEVNLGYKDIADLSVYVPFELKEEPNTYLLVWTTTPWTLPGNVAAAVHKDFEYVAVTVEGDEYKEKTFILAKERLSQVLKDKHYTVVKEMKGSELVGKPYIPPFNYYYSDETIPHHEHAWKIYHADFVTLEDGTGAVHEAPAYGADDLLLAQKNNVPVIHHVGVDGKFKSEVKDFAGFSVKPKDNKEEKIDHTDTDVAIIKWLAHNGKLFAKEKITHSYPHCWRCDTPLLNYATDSWFVKVTDFKDRLVEENKKITWVPRSTGEYRFGNWLEGAHDWAISRSRYWGAPLPVWESEDKKERIVVGGIEDIKPYISQSGNTYFVMRHGEADNNVTNINSSSYKDEVHVTEAGKEQVKKAAGVYKTEDFDYIFASDFVRTKETAEIFAETIGFPKEKIIYDKRLEEVNVGDFAGKSNDAYHTYFSSLEEKFTKRPPNGESLTDVKKRVAAFLYEVEEKYKNKKILIVTHEYACWMMWTTAFGWSDKASAAEKATKEEFIKKGELIELPFVPLPHNEDYELDFHRPFIDEVVLEKDGKKFTRVKEVFDCWFESGSMPYGEVHYPFEKSHFDPKKGTGYPADFIAEGVDQTRGWFYSLLVLGVGLFDKAPYEHVIVNGLVLAEDGQKMSKRLKNYPDPMDVVAKYGADAVRYYMLSSPIVRGEDLAFSEKGVAEIANKVINRLLNVVSFYELFAGTSLVDFSTLQKEAEESAHVLDRFIIARLNEIIRDITTGMEAYELDRATRPLLSFIDDLSTWYLRRSRDRFKSDDLTDVARVKAVTRYVLLTLSKLVAPSMPFVAEAVYQKMKTQDGVDSVHLEKWPVVNESVIDVHTLELMDAVREVVTLGLEERNKVGIKVRQPLKTLRVKDTRLQGEEAFQMLIKDELNVKEVLITPELNKTIELDTAITAELKEEGNVRELIRAIQEKRKEEGLMPQDIIVVSINADPLMAEALSKSLWQDEVRKVVNAKEVVVGRGELAEGLFDLRIAKVED